MIPLDFTLFFSVMAGVGATLFGLIFLVISIKPEVTSTKNTAIMPQAQISSSYIAFINPLTISLLALVPHATIGNVTLTMSVVGLVSTVIMGINLFQEAKSWAKKLRSIFFILVSAVLYGYETYYAMRLVIAPGDIAALYDLTTQLVLTYVYGIARAWELIGARRFRIRDVVTPFLFEHGKDFNPNAADDENIRNANKPRK
jgi:hypothetical protein